MEYSNSKLLTSTKVHVSKKGDLVVVHGPNKALDSNLVLGAAFMQRLAAVAV